MPRLLIALAAAAALALPSGAAAAWAWPLHGAVSRRVPTCRRRRRSRPGSAGASTSPRRRARRSAPRARGACASRAASRGGAWRSRVACGTLRATYLRLGSLRVHARGRGRRRAACSAALGPAGRLRLGARRARRPLRATSTRSRCCGPRGRRRRCAVPAPRRRRGAPRVAPRRAGPPARARVSRSPGGWRSRCIAAGLPVGGARARAPPARTAVARRGRCARPACSLRRDGLLLRHHADLLRQRGAAPRARVHDDRRRRDGAPPPPARRGRVLPHRHRRARRAGRATRPKAQGVDAAELADRNAERFKALAPVLDVTNDFFIRTSDPEHIAPGAGGPPARPRQRLRPQGPLRGLVLPALRGLQDRERDRGGQPLPDPPHRARARAGGELLLRALRLPGAPRGALRRRSPTSSRRARATTRRSSFIKSGLQDVSLTRANAHLGRAGPVGRRARLLRLVRRAAELLHGARLRAATARTSPSASGRRATTSSARTSSSSTRSSGRRC